LLLLVSTRSYRTEDFRAAARRLGVPLVLGSDRCHRIEETFGEEPGLISLDYRDPRHAAEQIAEAARSRSIRGVVPVDEGTAVIAALAAEKLGLPHNPPEAARRAANKYAMRVALAEALVSVPRFWRFDLDEGARWPARQVTYPCVLKPLLLSASRGVIRADDPEGFVAAWDRLARILHAAHAERRPRDDRAARQIMVETFVPGAEVAVEALLRGGQLEMLALFDKPDPLDGPFFEETIYVTPSRHPAALQGQIERTTAAAARALGLVEGPVHAELRLPPEEAGAARRWAESKPEQTNRPVVLEVAARSIGGLCARTLRFGAGLSLEEIIVAHAMGLPLSSLTRERRASGVMMIPIPRRGVLHGVTGLESARAVRGVEDVVVTAAEGRELEPLPEGDAYLGFIFARADRPEEVEAALRSAHARLRFDIRPALPTV
jgi:biotin carboxylase